ncbi:MAG TPA: hypothetical protein VH678_30465 [Xanthobacteraceae bacterium]|jgi:hypothetical protein
MEKFVKLLALAGSDNDAEALAAVRAARKRLKELNLDWNDMASMLRKAADEINKKRAAEQRSEKRARFKASPQGKIATYRRFVREHKKALKRGDEVKAWLWQMRADKALEDMDPKTSQRLTQLDRRRERRCTAPADELWSSLEWSTAA